MAFEGLTQRLAGTFKKLKNRGKLSEADVKEAMREVRLALLEADVNYKRGQGVCGGCDRKVHWRGRAGKPDPRPAGHKDSQRRADRADGQYPPAHQSFFPYPHRAC